MKKIILIGIATIFLTACDEKQNYEDAVLAQMKTEKDIKDYNITPEHMTKCVVETSTEKMPGLFPLDPVRLTSFKNYTKMLSMNTVEDKQGKLEELRSIFGSPAELAKAHSSYTESVMNCISAILMEPEKNNQKKP